MSVEAGCGRMSTPWQCHELTNCSQKEGEHRPVFKYLARGSNR